ncbi:branched-chain amino acid ABC transporter permease [Variovorax sp. RTB1]|jgi:branched-chain amino acid transport system permease protein|uniref:branched-chain amino acid ABC transporter permease n=1 Tax=Variovorax sp. RTB1 TaxID=3048631 RepID=UPI002B226586|nr:branched-chain amino acid ABC transporter permease [Variovorax sp. RTB1]MEB0113767.1 branched-chain amino acid ABC transporter permease [Variovorax sp. RTB1]
MQLFIEQLINGCALGALYALFGLGFGIVFSTLGILNAAHGSYASWAAIAALAAVEQLKLPFLPALVVGVVGGGLLAVVVDQIAFQPLRKRGSGMLGALITSIAFWIILDNLAGTATGQQSLSFPRGSYPGTMFHLGDIPIPAMQLITVAVMLVVTFGLHILIRRSRFGAAMRAVGWNQTAASLGGVNPRYVVIVTAFIAGATSGLAGVLGGITTHNVSFLLGEGLLLKGFAAVVVGGYDDVRGTAVAGVGLGVLEVMSAQYLSSGLRDGITYALLLTFLLVRPRGLFGSLGFSRA